MESDRNLLFGVLALQADVLARSQFIEACTAWATLLVTAALAVDTVLLSEAERRTLWASRRLGGRPPHCAPP
jgi:hypothetical protein